MTLHNTNNPIIGLNRELFNGLNYIQQPLCWRKNAHNQIVWTLNGSVEERQCSISLLAASNRTQNSIPMNKLQKTASGVVPKSSVLILHHITPKKRSISNKKNKLKCNRGTSKRTLTSYLHTPNTLFKP